MWLTITTIWEADTSICYQEVKNSSLLMTLFLSLIKMLIVLTQLTLRLFFVALTTVETNCYPIPNFVKWSLSMMLPSQVPSEVAVEATMAAQAGQLHRPSESLTVHLLLSPTIQDMKMNNLIESALLVPFPRKKIRKGLSHKRTLLFSVGPLEARRRKRLKRKKKVYSAADLDPRCLLHRRERLMVLRIHRVNKLRKINKKRNKMRVKKVSLNSTASLMLLSIKSELTRNLR